VLWEIPQLRATCRWLSPKEWSRRTSFNVRTVSLFCGNQGFLHYSVESLVRHGCPRLRSNFMPITIPNYSRKTDRLQIGTLIGITSEW
jgi:hypothetical protein